MFNKEFRPLSNVVDYTYCDYSHLPYRIRQKMRNIQSYLLNVQHASKCNYKVYLFDDGCVLVDPLRNKILWKYDYYSSLGILFALLEEIYRFYQYETHCKTIKNNLTRNDWLTLRQKYYGY